MAKRIVTYDDATVPSGRAEEDESPSAGYVQTSLLDLGDPKQKVEGIRDPANTVALSNTLRRHGVEGEQAFLVLAARYVEFHGIAGRTFAFFPVQRAVATLSAVRRDQRVIEALERVVRADPDGRELPTWYQYFFGRRFREGSGKFFTPRPIANAMAKLLPVTAGCTVLDPTCGGGTFLREASNRWKETPCRLVGNDVDSMLVGLTELLLALCAPVVHEVALTHANLYDADEEFASLRGTVNHILANPPFSLPLESLARPGGLFAMGYRNSDALFLDVCLELLAPGGNLVCLLPHSLVVNGEFEPLRRAVEKQWELCGIITLPEGVFHLTGNTTARADIVHLKKRKGRDRSVSTVFFANAPTVGFSLNSRTTHPGENQLDSVVNDLRSVQVAGGTF